MHLIEEQMWLPFERIMFIDESDAVVIYLVDYFEIWDCMLILLEDSTGSLSTKLAIIIIEMAWVARITGRWQKHDYNE